MTLEDFVEGNTVFQLHRDRGTRLRYKLFVQYAYVLGPIVMIVGLSLLFASLRSGSEILIGAMLIVGSAFVGCGVNWLLIPRSRRRKLARIFRERKEPVECVLTADELGIVSVRTDRAAESRISWSMFENVVEMQNNFVAMLEQRIFFPIPKRAMTPEQQQELRALLAAHIPQAGAPLPAVS
jgi:hypothetical protein